MARWAATSRRLVLAMVAAAAALAMTAGTALASTTVVSGLANPAETATDSAGNLYYTAGAGGGTITLYELAAGSSARVAVTTLSGVLPRIFDITSSRLGLTYIEAAGDYSTGRHYALVARFGQSSVTLAESDAVLTSDETSVTSGFAIEVVATDGSGPIYYGGRRYNAVSGADDFELYAIDGHTARLHALRAPGQSSKLPSPQLLATFPGGGVFDPLVPSPNGGVYLGIRTRGVVFVGLDGSETTVAAPQSSSGNLVVLRPLGMDAVGDLYITRRTFQNLAHFGCADSTTFDVIRFTAADLTTPGSPGAQIATYTEPGFVAWWTGSSAFTRVSANGAAAFTASPVTANCPTGSHSPFTTISDQVLAMPAGGGSLVVVYEERGPWIGGPPAPAPDEGPLALAFDLGDSLYVASVLHGTVSRM